MILYLLPPGRLFFVRSLLFPQLYTEMAYFLDLTAGRIDQCDTGEHHV